MIGTSMSGHGWMVRCVRAAALALALAPAACSADAAVAPEPAVETPGTFVATYADGQFGLFRSLGTVSYFGDSFVVMLVYEVRPSSWDDAIDLAKRAELPARDRVQYRAPSQLPEHRPVWFRTLTRSEEAVRFK